MENFSPVTKMKGLETNCARNFKKENKEDYPRSGLCKQAENKINLVKLFVSFIPAQYSEVHLDTLNDFL